MPGHGSSVAVQHGSFSLDPSDDDHDKDLRLATDVIRNGTSLLSSQAPSAERNNLFALSQVGDTTGSRLSDKESERQRVLDKHVVSWWNAFGDAPLLPGLQKQLDMRVRTEELAKAQEQVALKGQPVLGMTFCVNRRKEIARLAEDSVLRDKYDLGTEPLFEKFRQKNSSGDRPYYCVSEDILGRAIHTFQEEYVSKSKAQQFSEEFNTHVAGIVAEAKDSMSKEAVAIRMRNQNLVDQQHRLREEARIQCEKAFADVNQRLKDTSDA